MSTSVIRSLRARDVIRLTPLCGLVLGAWLVAACGGRTETVTQGPDGSSAAGGSPASAGASSGRAGAGQAGSAVITAGAPGAGAPGAGTGGNPAVCDDVACFDITCPSGTEATVPAGQCCPICLAQCNQACLSCPIDTHPIIHMGDCCPTCEPDMQIKLSCQAGQMQYESLRTQMIDKYSHGCETDSDCVVVAASNACEAGCRYVALLSVVATDFIGNTSSQGAIDCATCRSGALPSCAPPPPAVCVSRVCELSVGVGAR